MIMIEGYRLENELDITIIFGTPIIFYGIVMYRRKPSACLI